MMRIEIIKKSILTLAALATLTASDAFINENQAEAGRRDFWAGAGAGFVTGAIVNEVVRPRRYRERVYRAPRRSSWDAHVSWCYDRYRSYSERDDRYTRRSGARVRCRSPYR